MIKRLIFDVDGTLIAGVSFDSTIETTLKRMKIYSEENVKKFLEAISSYEKLFDSYNKNDYINYFEEILGLKLGDNFLYILFDELKKCVPLDNEKIRSSIYDLSTKYELVLLTNYFKESQLNRLHTMGIDHLFLECYGEELIKPHNEIYLKACGTYNPDECVMIGDDFYLDIQKSQSLGINTILVDSKCMNVDNIKTLTVNAVEEISIDLIESIIKPNKTLTIKP